MYSAYSFSFWYNNQEIGSLGEFEGHHTEFVIPKFPVQLISCFLI